MEKIQYAVWKKETNSAGGKAKNDALDIAEKLGFIPSYKPSDNRFVRAVQQFFSIAKMPKDKVVLVQYPAVTSKMLNRLFKHLKSGNKTIGLIHDLPSIQGMQNSDESDELKYLKKFDCLIAHNEKMKALLEAKGYVGNIVCLDLFDYLHDVNKELRCAEFSNTICFAGNLKKSTFLLELGVVSNCEFNLYGIKGDMNFDNITNLHYKGCLSSEEIVFNLAGDYGLIWDGDSIEACSGVHGQYLQYNNPHKLSLYIAAGKPVITWKKAAIADFVLRENIGIVVNSLAELNEIDLSLNYGFYRNNVLNIKGKIGKGEYLATALCVAVNCVDVQI